MILKPLLSQSSSTTLRVIAVVDEQLLFNPFCLPRLQGKTTEETTNHDMFLFIIIYGSEYFRWWFRNPAFTS